jgi:hypothetical protein
LSLDVDDVEQAVYLAKRLKKDELFYKTCSEHAKENYKRYYNIEKFKEKML